MCRRVCPLCGVVPHTVYTTHDLTPAPLLARPTFYHNKDAILRALQRHVAGQLAARFSADRTHDQASATGSSASRRRVAEEDPFAALNDLLMATEITVPDQSFFDPLECEGCKIGICPLCTTVPGNIWADIKNLKCKGAGCEYWPGAVQGCTK